jgi:hypothetical protein
LTRRPLQLWRSNARKWTDCNRGPAARYVDPAQTHHLLAQPGGRARALRPAIPEPRLRSSSTLLTS